MFEMPQGPVRRMIVPVREEGFVYVTISREDSQTFARISADALEQFRADLRTEKFVRTYIYDSFGGKWDDSDINTDTVAAVYYVDAQAFQRLSDLIEGHNKEVDEYEERLGKKNPAIEDPDDFIRRMREGGLGGGGAVEGVGVFK